MDIQPIVTKRAPAAIGPYSQAVRAGNLVFVSGQLALDPATGQLVGADAAAQMRQALENLRQILAAAGCGLDRVVKTTLYLADMKDFAAVNEVYAAAFGQGRPARATVQVARLPRDALVELDAVAVKDGEN